MRESRNNSPNDSNSHHVCTWLGTEKIYIRCRFKKGKPNRYIDNGKSATCYTFEYSEACGNLFEKEEFSELLKSRRNYKGEK